MKYFLVGVLVFLMSGCIPFTVISGIVGVADSVDKSGKIKQLEEKVEKLEKSIPTPKPNWTPYVPSIAK